MENSADWRLRMGILTAKLSILQSFYFFMETLKENIIISYCFQEIVSNFLICGSLKPEMA